MSDHKVFGPCGPKWKPVQNAAAMDFFKKFTEAGHMNMETAGSLDGGKHVWGLARINSDIVLPGDDRLSGYLLLSNPHIWGKSMTIMFTPIRVVCMNTLMMAMSVDGERFRHPHSIEWTTDTAAKAEEALGLGKLLMDRCNSVFTRLATTKVPDNVVELFIAQSLSPAAVTDFGTDKVAVNRGDYNRATERVLELVHTQPGAEMESSKGTLWGAANAITYYYDHEYGKSVDSRMTSAWFGQNKIVKERAFKLALETLDMVA